MIERLDLLEDASAIDVIMGHLAWLGEALRLPEPGGWCIIAVSGRVIGLWAEQEAAERLLRLYSQIPFTNEWIVPGTPLARYRASRHAASGIGELYSRTCTLVVQRSAGLDEVDILRLPYYVVPLAGRH